jgi:hypothetical protein
MLYIVECSYADPESEAGWNRFYSEDKLPALVSVSGFRASQRFRALSSGCPVYLAIHTIHDAIRSPVKRIARKAAAALRAGRRIFATGGETCIGTAASSLPSLRRMFCC